MFSNAGTLFLLKTSIEVLIILNLGGLFGLNIEINGKTWSTCFCFGFLSAFCGISRAFLIQFLAIIAGQLHIFFGFSKRCLNFSCCFSTMFVTSLVAFQLLLHSAFQLFSTILRVKVNIYFSYNDSDDWMKKGDIYECL